MQGHPESCKVIHISSAEHVAERSGMARRFSGHAVKGRGLAQTQIQPVARLVDGADMTSGWVGITHDEPQIRVTSQVPQDDANESGFGVGREFVAKP